ncbi:MAG TPA: HAD hydrolase-like protein, partial [Gemmatimonadaceae bacterium]|nr:HAD hydrolase-like protein [Gemmatimonadaceae bacterium]
AAIEESGINPQNLVMIGDTPYDIEAASKAKVRTIAFRSGGWTDEALEGAVEVYNSPADLLACFDSSLIGREKRGIR